MLAENEHGDTAAVSHLDLNAAAPRRGDCDYDEDTGHFTYLSAFCRINLRRSEICVFHWVIMFVRNERPNARDFFKNVGDSFVECFYPSLFSEGQFG